MRFFNGRSISIGITGLAIIGVAAMAYHLTRDTTPRYTTATVERGTVEQLVSVSGVAEALQQADLGFPIPGVIATISVQTGDSVAAGDTLATLRQADLQADRQAAAATLAQARATLAELVAGPTDTTRAAADETVTLKEAALATVRTEQAQAIRNAYRTLLSDGLAAVAVDPSEEAPAPTVSGTYTCDEPGTYELEVYTSDTRSGYSYHVRGLETGSFPVSTTQPAPLGACGLRIQFAADENYHRSEWRIDIPNPDAAVYTKNVNAYQTARTVASTSIRLAEQELALAVANAANTVAPARREAIAGATAAVEQAAAQLTRIDAQLTDRRLTAPFAGTIADVTAEPGETVSTAPIITMLTGEQFEVTARIPEIDIGKLAVGQTVRMTFDARPSEPLTGTIRFVSPQATIIDGVSYYEAIITPDTTPAWIRSGLNADIDIIIDAAADSLRIPRRFLIETDTGHAVQQLSPHGGVSTTTVTLRLAGNDGYAAITGLSPGATVVAPE